MAIKITKLTPEGYAALSDTMDEVVETIVKSVARKQARHGEDFDPRLALYDILKPLSNKSPESVLVLAAMALQRLAELPSIHPLSEELAALDFDTDPNFDETAEVEGD